MKYSIIVPVYNVEQYLEECVCSLINQTYLDIEIILVNDGSTDNSKLICKELAKKDNRIKLIDKPNGGLSSARNAGIKVAEGEYILFVDSDDCLDLTAIERIDLVTKSTPDVIISEIYNTYDVKKYDSTKILFPVPNSMEKNDVINYVFSKNDLVYPAPQYIVRKDLIKRSNLLFILIKFGT